MRTRPRFDSVMRHSLLAFAFLLLAIAPLSADDDVPLTESQGDIEFCTALGDALAKQQELTAPIEPAGQ